MVSMKIAFVVLAVLIACIAARPSEFDGQLQADYPEGVQDDYQEDDARFFGKKKKFSLFKPFKFGGAGGGLGASAGTYTINGVFGGAGGLGGGGGGLGFGKPFFG